MPTIEATTHRGRWYRPTLRPKRGWVGIDLGTRAIKLAQLTQHGTGWRLAARWTLSDSTCELLSRNEILGDRFKSRLSSLKSLRRIFTGRACATVLPMSLVDFRSFEVPRGSIDELTSMVAEELAADLNTEPAELAFGCWEAHGDNGLDPELTRMATLAIPKRLAAKLTTDLLSAGLECHVLNGLPWALARAVELANPAAADEAELALDLGYTSPLLVLVKDGRPVFSRVLRGVGLQSLMQPLQDELKISPEACQQLLVRFGVPVPGEAPSVASHRTFQVIANPLQHLVGEIERTMTYIHQQFRTLTPRRMWLFGGGATVKRLPEYVTHKLRFPCEPWSLDRDAKDAEDALYGVAAALSSLAWETDACI